jgi:hypothetical protein
MLKNESHTRSGAERGIADRSAKPPASVAYAPSAVSLGHWRSTASPAASARACPRPSASASQLKRSGRFLFLPGFVRGRSAAQAQTENLSLDRAGRASTTGEAEMRSRSHSLQSSCRRMPRRPLKESCGQPSGWIKTDADRVGPSKNVGDHRRVPRCGRLLHAAPVDGIRPRNHFSIIARYPAIMAEECEETALQTIRRRYAAVAAWLVRGNRGVEPSRMPEPPRAEIPPRIVVPPRPANPPRPW